MGRDDAKEDVMEGVWKDVRKGVRDEEEGAGVAAVMDYA